ncbi:protein DOG1-like 1 [Nymphaea colorata]|uniref:protein DOG1-like 1 n=1 Tax=Nymphaea colorata TaxID=210225 RepID=UPI00129E82EF|nr:protein DOG1-like 1 [Nymphaea colorata]
MSIDDRTLCVDYHAWISQQQADLHELRSAINPSFPDDQTLVGLITKSLSHYHDYIVKRAEGAKADAPALFAPKWNSTFENAHLWLGGCRPTQYFRLLYAICGHEVESRLQEHLEGLRIGALGELSCEQLTRVSEFQCRTVAEEDRLTKKMVRLQEEVSDQPMALVASEKVDISESDLDSLIDRHARSLGHVMVEADMLRFNALKELVEQILTPRQAVDFLIAAKQLHSRIHEWGMRRDHQRGRE